jgi:hypothetical protein
LIGFSSPYGTQAALNGLYQVGLVGAFTSHPDHDFQIRVNRTMVELRDLALNARRRAHRTALLVTILTVLAVALAIALLPDRTLLVALAALVILGMEYLWASRWLRDAHEYAESLLALLSDDKSENAATH